MDGTNYGRLGIASILIEVGLWIMMMMSTFVTFFDARMLSMTGRLVFFSLADYGTGLEPRDHAC